MSEPHVNAIPTPRRRTNVRVLTSLAMLTAIAYVVGGIVYVSYVDGYYRKLRGNSGK